MPKLPTEYRDEMVMKNDSNTLNGWKHIAAYLGKGVRTVQRWERDLCLPIHRPDPSNTHAVFALRPEIEGWLRNNMRPRPKVQRALCAPRAKDAVGERARLRQLTAQMFNSIEAVQRTAAILQERAAALTGARQGQTSGSSSNPALPNLFSATSTIPQWLSDSASTRIVDVNDAACEFWRYRREDLIGMRATSLLCDGEIARSDELKSANAFGKTGPWHCRRGDGSDCFVTVQWKQISYVGMLCDFVFPVRVQETSRTMSSVTVSQKEPSPPAPGAHP
jgi:PAS domain-containing protein